jgi:hypothetical protein
VKHRLGLFRLGFCQLGLFWRERGLRVGQGLGRGDRPGVLGGERLFVTGKRRPREFQRLVGAPAGNERSGQQTALAVCLGVVGAKAAPRARQQILTREDRFRPLILQPQRRLELVAGDDAQRDQIVAEPAARPLLTRERELDLIFARQPLRNQKVTEKHVSRHRRSFTSGRRNTGDT